MASGWVRAFSGQTKTETKEDEDEDEERKEGLGYPSASVTANNSHNMIIPYIITIIVRMMDNYNQCPSRVLSLVNQFTA